MRAEGFQHTTPSPPGKQYTTFPCPATEELRRTCHGNVQSDLQRQFVALINLWKTKRPEGWFPYHHLDCSKQCSCRAMVNAHVMFQVTGAIKYKQQEVTNRS